MGIFEKFKLGLQKTASSFSSGLKEIIIKNTKTEISGVLLKDGNLYITRDNDITLKSEFWENMYRIFFFKKRGIFWLVFEPCLDSSV